jgi:hypothetical protein
LIRKTAILIIGYITIGTLIFASCEGLLKYDATICDIDFAGINSANNFDLEEPDRFEDQIGFGVWALPSSPTCFEPIFELFSSAYATTKCAEFQNELLKSTYQLFFDRQIILDNDTIKPNTDLLSIQDIIVLTDIYINEECKLVNSTIIFRKELIEKTYFETGEYLVTFNCSTSDNKHFTKTRKVIFKE